MIKDIKQFLFIASLLLIAAGAQPVGAAFWQWSTTASTNASADPNINWAEGMSPSSVNDSARAMMAQLANWRNDISGGLVTTGTSTAYILTTSQGLCPLGGAPANNTMVAFTAHAANGSVPTISVDGCGAIGLATSPGSTAPAGTLSIGMPYRIVYSSGATSWLLEGAFSDPYNIPLGGIIWSTLPTPPNANYVAAAGQCISTSTYAAYWAALGSPASGACPGGQFAIIDLRGRVVAGLDTMNLSAANRLTSSANGCGVAFTSIGAVCNENQSATLTATNLPPYTPAGSVSTSVSPSAAYTAGATPGTAQSGSNLTLPIGVVTPAYTASSSFTGTPAPGQNSTPFSKVQPTIGMIPYLRVL